MGENIMREETGSVGSLQPVTVPDQVLAKKINESSIDDEFNSLDIFKTEEGTNVNESVKEDNLKVDENEKMEITESAKDFEYHERQLSMTESIYDTGMGWFEESVNANSKEKAKFLYLDLQVKKAGYVPVSKDEKKKAKSVVTDAASKLMKEIESKFGNISKFSGIKKKTSNIMYYVIWDSAYLRIESSILKFSGKDQSSKELFANICDFSKFKAKDLSSDYKLSVSFSGDNADKDVLSIYTTIKIQKSEEVKEVKESAEEFYVFESAEEELYLEESNRDIDADLKAIIKKLNEKGYKTKYSCSGHPSSRVKGDVYKDGVKDGKLYSTARIVFAKIYDFPNIPKYWKKKILDEDKTAIYVKAPTFQIIKGIPETQIKNWKERYMYQLEKWVDSLPNESETKNEKSSEVALESADDLNDLINEMQIDLI